MRALLTLLLLTTTSCGRSHGYKVFMSMEPTELNATGFAFLELQLQSRNTKISSGTKDDHNIVIEYASNAELYEDFGNSILGVAWVSENFCRIQIAERTYKSGQDWVNAVVWHEIGHCVGLEHADIEDDIMYPFGQGLSRYSQMAKKRFFEGLYEKTN